MLEIRHLETLTAIREGGSLQEAAERLHLTQSALSHQLRDLETRLGTPLLNRRTRPARLTTAGLRVLALADEVLPRIRATERELQRLAAGRSGRLHLAIDCHSCFQWLMPALDAFRVQWPDVALDLSAAFSFAPLPALVRGDLDLVITSDPQPLEAVQYLPLFKYELCWRSRTPIRCRAASSCCPSSWPTRPSSPIRWTGNAWTSSRPFSTRPTWSPRPCARRS